MILKDFFNGDYRSIEKIDYWVVPQIEPFIEDENGDYVGELEVDFNGCNICPSRLARVFFHTIRNGVKMKCINYTEIQKAMINFVYKDVKNRLNRSSVCIPASNLIIDKGEGER